MSVIMVGATKRLIGAHFRRPLRTLAPIEDYWGVLGVWEGAPSHP